MPDENDVNGGKEAEEEVTETETTPAETTEVRVYHIVFICNTYHSSEFVHSIIVTLWLI